jgi:amino acid transporter
MAQQERKTPIFRVVAYAIMIVGILLFVLTPLFLRYFDLDTDLVGVLVVLAGLAVLILGSAIRLVLRKRKGRQT